MPSTGPPTTLAGPATAAGRARPRARRGLAGQPVERVDGEGVDLIGHTHGTRNGAPAGASLVHQLAGTLPAPG